MVTSSDVDWTKVPDYVSYVLSTNAMLLEVYNSDCMTNGAKNSRIAGILNHAFYS